MMLYFSLRFFRTISNIGTRRLLHKHILKMENAYFQHLDGSESFEMIFKLNNPTLKIDRTFNFKRKIEETVETFLGRVSVNVDKILSKKKNKKKKSESENTNETPELSIGLYENDKRIDASTSCKNVFINGKNINLKILDNTFKIIINSPWINKLCLPSSILAGFPVYPTKFEAIFTEKDMSSFTWYKHCPNTKQWLEVGNGYLYTPTTNDVGCKLKLVCTPRNQLSCGPETETESSTPVEAGPGECPFETRHKFTSEKLNGNNFRVVTYNILADLYTDSDYTRQVLFPYCPPYVLSMDYRKQLLLKEIIGYNGDIICLQEVDGKIFDLDLSPVFTQLNYKGCFSKKAGSVTEGLGCFYNSKRFREIHFETIIFGEQLETNPVFSEIWDKIKLNKPLCERIKPRSTALQIVALESIDNHDEIILVANIHLYFHPDADHVRLLQGGLAICYVEHVIKELKQKNVKKRISLIFCGDFNSTPDCGIYRLFRTGNAPSDLIDWSSNPEEVIKDLSLTQNILMESACGTPKYTNYTAGFRDCLDYIYYQTDSFVVTQVVPLPSEEELSANVALPSVVFPSDHIALISDLKWT